MTFDGSGRAMVPKPPDRLVALRLSELLALCALLLELLPQLEPYAEDAESSAEYFVSLQGAQLALVSALPAESSEPAEVRDNLAAVAAELDQKRAALLARGYLREE